MPGAAVVKVRAVVGRVQLAAEARAPAVGGVEPGNAVHDALEDAQVGSAAQLRMASVCPLERCEEGRRQRDGM